ncbi:NAD(P)/FAD-dependent oxidoreductase [Peptostreptococcus equinus]|uniref:NAD(P)/FAD-dependent oxidoreductase n=1 Tax=Peptostreptococcus equinus TaxID=3003601 RepID=A0ABY7JSZ1_9FIRM|nr:NAD(P)/FAD-dependent oxidoreductase [Peptostreptococcus sp. CBA3647]WAW15584.1 NAD(P)/FAD-dependent oxidoreductase [Peptostreptococcus sp. CBA3647]
MKRIIVVGGGPAGILAAYFASKEGNEVILLEKNDRLGKKLRITGKGRCNITNACDIEDFINNMCVNNSFMYSSFYSFTNDNALELFKKYGLDYKEERGKRIFPRSDKAIDFIKVLEDMLKDFKVKIKFNSSVKEIIIDSDKNIKAIKLKDKSTIQCDSLILATGGRSYPKTGSTGDGYEIAKKLGHSIIKPKPALIGLETKEKIEKNQIGLILKNISIDLYENDRKVYSDFGELEYREYGIDGPTIKSASCHIKNPKNCKIIVNLKPALSKEKLDKRIQRDFEKYSKSNFKEGLKGLLHRSMINTIVERTGINSEKPISQINKMERKKLIEAISSFTYNIDDFRKIDEAIVTSGGIDVKDIDPHTMESKKVNNLYFAGEIIDVHAYTGGFNLQIAYSTAYLAGTNASEE